MSTMDLHVCIVVSLLMFAGVRSQNEGVRSVKLGFISPPVGPFGYSTCASATTMAVDDAQKDGYLTGINVSVVWKNGACDGKKALGMTVALRDEENPDAYIGLPCSIASINAGKLLAHWDIPHFSYSSPDPILANKVMYNTLVRLVSPFNKLAEAMWMTAVMVSGPDPDHYCDYASRSLDDTFRFMNITLSLWIKAEQTVPDSILHQWLDQITTRGRIVIICVVEPLLRRFLLAAHGRGMSQGQYVFIVPNLLPSPNMERLWETGLPDDVIAREAYQPVLQMALGYVSSAEAEQFRAEVPKYLALPPWNYNETLILGKTGSVYSLYLYDSVYMYAMAADAVIKQGYLPRNGTMIFNTAKKLRFQGKSGKVVLDENGDRIAEYWIWHMVPNDDSFTLFAEINITAPPYRRVHLERERFWGLSGYDPPKDTPDCGFFEELCPPDTTGRDVIIIVVALVFVMVGVAVGLGVLVYRRRKFEEDLTLMLWKVRYEDISFVKTRGKSDGYSKSEITVHSSDGKSESQSQFSQLGHGTSGIDVGNYKGQLVTVKHLKKIGVMLSRIDHLELKVMRELQHENVNPFVGMCVDSPHICILTKYCAKGGLPDILENDNIRLDIMFKSSLIADLIAGLEYIHKSPIHSHGRLKSSNCVIDSRWMLKITDFGIHDFREDPDDADRHKVLLWTAPEILIDPNPDRNGTQKGDVFSFAIILQEIIYRCGPYETTGALPMVPKDLIGRIRNGETPPFRPELPTPGGQEKVDTRLMEIIRDCWADDPHIRPDMSTVKARFSALNKGRRYNIMDNMLRMLEKYANNLEEVVNERTRQLTEEKKKTDLLLYRMLPPSVADSLKSGKTISPEVFKNSTIYFSDIVSFTEMSSSSSAIEIVDFLNDLWTVFDDTIAKFNIYKVETIGDAYMVVGGVPTVTEDHATEIANMALDIVSAVITFKIRHKPEKQLQVRIGLHSGSVAAGVVGLTMPRFCLFGDTVNTASRMESTGKPMRIQISCSTYELLEKERIYFTHKRGRIPVKGKGTQTTYWLYGKEGYTRPLPKFNPADEPPSDEIINIPGK